MAIDTSARRNSAFLDQFIILPDGTIGVADRMTLVGDYEGITAGSGMDVTPATTVVATSGTAVFYSNQPASWSAISGTIVAAADHMSATYTAPGSPGTDIVTATDLGDPLDTDSANVGIVASGGVAGGPNSHKAIRMGMSMGLK